MHQTRVKPLPVRKGMNNILNTRVVKYLIIEKDWQFDKIVLNTNDKEVAEKEWDKLKNKKGALVCKDRYSGIETITIRPVPIKHQSYLSLLYGTFNYSKAGF